jgi:iron complex outermembrane receptor protein
MKKLNQLFFTTIFTLLFTSLSFGQTSIKGKVLDSSTGEVLVGASVYFKDMSKGTMTSLDGTFEIFESVGDQTVIFSFLGYQTLELSAKEDMGNVEMVSTALGLEEVSVIANVAVDRKTPVAVSTIGPKYVNEYAGTQEFPELLKVTPGVYATKQGGGVGDARVNIRGFDQRNVAVLINGIPVNDMENGWVYWSNWNGLGDAVSQVQVQRGLGASKLAINSIGGTMNIITKTTDAEKGGSFQTQVSSWGQLKNTLSYSTGKMDDGSAVSAVVSNTTGDGYIDGTFVRANSYFLSYAKDITDDQLLTFTAIGAPQQHGQRDRMLTPEEVDQYGIKYNKDWGYYNGEMLNQRVNYYHKPQLALNHYWTINPKTRLSTSAYVSVGKGGGSGPLGEYAPVDENGQIDWDAAAAWNDTASMGSQTILRNSVNNHNWVGLLSTLRNELNDNWDLTLGIDGRHYKGEHFREVRDLLGGEYWNEEFRYAVDGVAGRDQIRTVDDNSTSLWYGRTPFENRIAYDNDGLVTYGGVFGQAEYSKDNLSAFLAGSVSNTWNTRVDRFNYANEEDQTSETVSVLGYNAKVGANYNIDENNNAFFNAGYYSRAPFFNFLFQNYQNVLSDNVVNEKALAFEGGYQFKSKRVATKVNAYYTQWRDKTLLSGRIPTADGGTTRALINGQGALHKGVEVEFKTKPTSKLDLGGLLSIGDWKWQGDVFATLQSDIDQSIDTVSVYTDGLYVGNAPQQQFGVTGRYQLNRTFDIGGQFVYNDKLFANYDPTRNETIDDKIQPYQLDPYGLLDLRVGARFELLGLDSYAQVQCFNVLDTFYWAEGRDNGTGDGLRDGFPGWGRTFNASLKLNF